MPRCRRLQIMGLCLALGVLLSACDPKPTAATNAPAADAAPLGASPSGIVPAPSDAPVAPSTAPKGPSDGGTAIGGPSGPGGGAAAK